MKDYKEIIKELENNKTISEYELHEKQRYESQELIKKYDIKTFKERLCNQEFIAEDLKLSKKQDKELENVKNKNIYNIILKNNLRILCYNQVYPLILDLMNKYKNKPCGDKTYKKFKDEFYQITNEEFKISLNGKTLFIRPTFFKNDCTIEINTKWNKEEDCDFRFLTKGNKFNSLEMDQTYINNDIYIEDIPMYINTLKEKLSRIEEKNQELEKMIKEYNKLADIDGLRNYDKKDYFFENII